MKMEICYDFLLMQYLMDGILNDFFGDILSYLFFNMTNFLKFFYSSYPSRLLNWQGKTTLNVNKVPKSLCQDGYPEIFGLY